MIKLSPHAKSRSARTALVIIAAGFFSFSYNQLPTSFYDHQQSSHQPQSRATASSADPVSSLLADLGYYPLANQVEPDTQSALSATSGVLTYSATAILNRLKTLEQRSQSLVTVESNEFRDEQEFFKVQLAELAIRLLTLAPTLSAQTLPDGIATIDSKTDTLKRAHALSHFTQRHAEAEINRAVKQLTSDFLTVMYGESRALGLLNHKQNFSKQPEHPLNATDSEELSLIKDNIAGLERNLRSYLNAVWNRPDMLRTQYLGRAMIGFMLEQLSLNSKDSHSNQISKTKPYRQQILSKIRELAQAHGINLANFYSSSMMMINAKNVSKIKKQITQSASFIAIDLIEIAPLSHGMSVGLEIKPNSELKYRKKMNQDEKVTSLDRFLFELRENGIGDGKMETFGKIELHSHKFGHHSQGKVITLPWITSSLLQSNGKPLLRYTAPEQYLATGDVQFGEARFEQDIGLTPNERMISKFSLPRAPLSKKISDTISPLLAEGMLKQAKLSVIGLASTYENGFSALKLEVIKENFSYQPFSTPNLGKANQNFNFDWKLVHNHHLEDPSAGRDSETLMSQQGYIQLLRQWRFEDWIPEMKRNIDEKRYDTWINEIQLKRNIKSYQAVNDAVELSSFIMATLRSELRKPEFRDALVDITARFLANKPMHPPVDIPLEIKQMPFTTHQQWQTRQKALDHYLLTHQLSHIEEHARTMLSDISFLLYGPSLLADIAEGIVMSPVSASALHWQKSLSELYRLCFRLSERTYADALIWQANFLGQTLASLVMIESAKNPDFKNDQNRTMEEQLAVRLQAKGLYLEHFFGNKFVQRDANGEKRETVIGDGTLLLTKNMAAESSAISHGAAAKDIRRADQHDLVAGADQIILTQGLADYFAPLNPKTSFARPKAISKIMDWLTQKDSLPLVGTRMRKGYSHIDFIYLPKLKVTSSTGQKITLLRKQILDAYPTHYADETQTLKNAGGPRVSSMSQVIDRTWHSRVVTGFRDPVLTRIAFLEEVLERLKKPKEFDANGFAINGNVLPEIYEIEFDREKFKPLKAEVRDPVTGALLKEAERDSHGNVGKKTKVGLQADLSSEDFKRLHFGTEFGAQYSLGVNARALSEEIWQLKSAFQESLTRAKIWYEIVNEKVHRKQEDLIKTGWIFMWVTERVHVRGMVYCSSYLDIAFRMAVGFSPEFEVGGYRDHVKAAGAAIIKLSTIAKMKEKGLLTDEKSSEWLSLNYLQKLFPKDLMDKTHRFLEEKAMELSDSGATQEIEAAAVLDHVVSPTALLINKGIPDENIQDFDLEDRTAFERAQVRYRVYHSRSSEVDAYLEIVLPRSNPDFNLMSNTESDETEATHLIEEALTIPLSQGYKLIDVSELGNMENYRTFKNRLDGKLTLLPQEPAAGTKLPSPLNSR